MRRFSMVLVALVLFELVSSLPVDNFIEIEVSTQSKTNDVDAEYGNHFEGDIILNDQQINALNNNENRNGLIDIKYRWPNNIVPYQLSPNHTTAQNAHILKALNSIESVSCIRFQPRINETGFVQLGNDSGCFSKVGFQDEKQVVNLQSFGLDAGCFRLGTIMHEFLHALGFYHMQSAYDRDEYVKIQWDHIATGKEHNFQKYNSNLVSHFNATYDYSSVMHYSGHAFSKDGVATIVPFNDSFVEVIGQRKELSSSDIIKLNAMYRCDNE